MISSLLTCSSPLLALSGHQCTTRIVHGLSDGLAHHLRTAWLRWLQVAFFVVEMDGKIGSFLRSVWLRAKQNDYPALVIIRSGNSYSYSTEEGTAYEEIQEQGRSEDGKEI